MLLIALHQLSDSRKVRLTSPTRGSYKITEETNLYITTMVFQDLMKASEKYDEIVEGNRETNRQETSYLQETTIAYPKSEAHETSGTTP